MRYRESVTESNFEAGKIAGRMEGREEGKAAGKIKVAKNMKNAGLTIEVIKQVTGLSIEEINDILAKRR